MCLRVCEFSPNGKLAILSELAPLGGGLASGNLLCHISRSPYISYISRSLYLVYLVLSQSLKIDDYDVDNQEGASDVIESIGF